MISSGETSNIGQQHLELPFYNTIQNVGVLNRLYEIIDGWFLGTVTLMIYPIYVFALRFYVRERSIRTFLNFIIACRRLGEARILRIPPQCDIQHRRKRKA